MLELKPHQPEAIDFLVSHSRAFLLDDVGVGKTIEAIMAHKQLGGNFIVSCETNKIFDWLFEYKSWAPQIKRFVIRGSKSQRSMIYSSFSQSTVPSVLVLNHHKVFPDLDRLLDIKTNGIIIDESEVFNNFESKLYQYMKWICRDKQCIWQLTAYPFGVNLLQFYTLFLMVGLDFFGSERDFMDRFCVLEQKHFYIKNRRITKTVITGAKNLEEFKAAVAPYCLRRTKKTAGIILPPVSFRPIAVQLTERQRHLYAAAKRNRLDCMTRKEKFEPIAKYAFITQILNSPHLIDETDSRESPKLDAVISLLKKLLITDKVVLFSQYLKWQPEILSRLTKENIPVLAYHGNLSPETKDDLVKTFTSSSRGNVFLCTAAAERGINLQVCSNIFVLDFEFNPVRMLQLFGRLDRIGQKNPITIYYFIAQDSHEEKIFERLFERQQLIDMVFDGDKAAAFDIEKMFRELLSQL